MVSELLVMLSEVLVMILVKQVLVQYRKHLLYSQVLLLPMLLLTNLNSKLTLLSMSHHTHLHSRVCNLVKVTCSNTYLDNIWANQLISQLHQTLHYSKPGPMLHSKLCSMHPCLSSRARSDSNLCSRGLLHSNWHNKVVLSSKVFHDSNQHSKYLLHSNRFTKGCIHNKLVCMDFLSNHSQVWHNSQHSKAPNSNMDSKAFINSCKTITKALFNIKCYNHHRSILILQYRTTNPLPVILSNQTLLQLHKVKPSLMLVNSLVSLLGSNRQHLVRTKPSTATNGSLTLLVGRFWLELLSLPPINQLSVHILANSNQFLS